MSFQAHINFTDVHGIISSTRMLGFYADILSGGGGEFYNNCKNNHS